MSAIDSIDRITFNLLIFFFPNTTVESEGLKSVRTFAFSRVYVL